MKPLNESFSIAGVTINLSKTRKTYCLQEKAEPTIYIRVSSPTKEFKTTVKTIPQICYQYYICEGGDRPLKATELCATTLKKAIETKTVPIIKIGNYLRLIRRITDIEERANHLSYLVRECLYEASPAYLRILEGPE